MTVVSKTCPLLGAVGCAKGCQASTNAHDTRDPYIRTCMHKHGKQCSLKCFGMQRENANQRFWTSSAQTMSLGLVRRPGYESWTSLVPRLWVLDQSSAQAISPGPMLGYRCRGCISNFEMSCSVYIYIYIHMYVCIYLPDNIVLHDVFKPNSTKRPQIEICQTTKVYNI